MRILITSFILFVSSSIIGQIVTMTPPNAERDQLITITYDATQGSAGLLGEDQVYMHTGLITENSTSNSDWKYVVGDWGTDDSRVKMTNIGNNKHELSYSINEFYGVPANEMIERLAFVFRNVDGSKEGKTASGGDIFLEYEDQEQEGFYGYFVTPTENEIFALVGDQIPVTIATSEEASKIQLFVNGENVTTVEDTNGLSYTVDITEQGVTSVSYRASKGFMLHLGSVSINANPIANVAELPSGAVQGITRLDDNIIRCVLTAPGKDNAYVIGTFNNWESREPYFMNRTPDGNVFWADVEVPSNENHALRYRVDGTIEVADPFSELVLDQWNDVGIDETVFPDIPNFGLPNFGYATWLKPTIDYAWQYDQPEIENENLVIYETLVRDFVDNRSYQEIIDTLDYLAGLGINAIEFMPINEFEGNESWGYNPSFHMALDKYYGTPEKFKELVDACHQRGIAVLLDVVYNHAFSQSPLAQMWWDDDAFRPTEDSPYLNVEAKHPFNVGYDFNHESPFTKSFVKRVTKYWIEEYKIDGFRFDLSKGFTQKDANGNVGAWGNYDASRVTILKDYANYIWSIDPDSKVILEHFADNTEEKELAAYGMLIWSNLGHTINDATMGFNNNSNFDWLDYKKRDWSTPNAVGYMESHDEERLMYKNLNFGRETSDYSIKELTTALQRVEAASAMFYAFPGPKMLWQFGEMGYDYSINRCSDGSINENCRLTPKPIRWDFLDDLARKRLVDVTTAIIKLKTEHNLTANLDYEYNLNGDVKLIRLENDELEGLIIANFGITSQVKTPIFPNEGTYYDYLTGESLEVDGIFMPLELDAGEYHIYLTKDFDQQIISGVEDELSEINHYRAYPNPTSSQLNIELDLTNSQVVNIFLIDALGKTAYENQVTIRDGVSDISIDTDNFSEGLYYLNVSGNELRITDRIVITN